MKKPLLILFLVTLVTSTNAIPPLFGPNGSLSMWRCTWNNDLTIEVSSDGNCHFQRTMTCTHWLWGSKTNGYEWERTCDINIVNDDEKPHDYDCPHGVETNLIAQSMQEINSEGIFVPLEFMDENILASDNQVLEDCFKFRMELAGYDVNDPLLFENCYIPIPTLPIQVPLYGAIPVDLSCISISPNPSSDYISINLNGMENQITAIQIVNHGTSEVVYEFNNPSESAPEFLQFLPESIIPESIINIDVNGLENGFYNVVIYRNEEILSTLIQIIN